MDNTSQMLVERINEHFGKHLLSCVYEFGEVTIDVPREQLFEICKSLRDTAGLEFDQLIDICGVDYIAYGDVEWETRQASSTGFSRGVERHAGNASVGDLSKSYGKRFAVVYHLLSVSLNQRIRVRSFVDEQDPRVPSVVELWTCANWFEREAFDLYGILFDSHPDLRRLLTDYGFIGHPFRKDFPLAGNVEMRYDAEKQRVIYEPVSIEPRVLVPRVIRDENAQKRA